MTEKENWRDTWKLEVEGHQALWTLHQSLREEVQAQWQRALPFAEELFDRWERAAHLGFGKGASIYDSSVVIGDVRVGEEAWIGPYTILDGSGGLSIGSDCSISTGVRLYSHDSVRWALSGGKTDKEHARTTIEDCCYIGPSAIIAKGVTIGKHSAVGANSLLKESVPPFSIAAGNPAKVIGRVELDENGDVSLVYE